MKILVTFALENEFAPWRALREFRAVQWGDAEVYRAQIGAAEVVVLLTGAGPKQAHLQTAKVLGGDQESIHLCVSSGLAGALKPEYRIGQVLAARSIRTENELTDSSSNLLQSSAALLSFAEECAATVVEQFFSSVRVVGSAEEKRHWASGRTLWRWKVLRFCWNRLRMGFRRSRSAPSVIRWPTICRW